MEKIQHNVDFYPFVESDYFWIDTTFYDVVDKLFDE
jgi:hypothetical protein